MVVPALTVAPMIPGLISKIKSKRDLSDGLFEREPYRLDALTPIPIMNARFRREPYRPDAMTPNPLSNS